MNVGEAQMNYRKVLFSGIISYLATIVFGLILASVLQIPLDIKTPPSQSLLLISMVLAIIFTLIGAIMVFQPK